MYRLWKLKLRLVFVPFMAIYVGFVLVYCFLHWFLFSALPFFPVHDDIVQLWLPIILAFVPVIIWLYPRFSYLQLGIRKPAWRLLPVVIGVAALAVTTIFALRFTGSATGEMRALEDPNQVAQQPLAKYYTFSNYYIDKFNSGELLTSVVSGDSSEELNLYVNFATPLWASNDDTARYAVAWIGTQYNRKISNQLSHEEVVQETAAFLQEARKDFERISLEPFQYLERGGNSPNADRSRRAIFYSRKHGGGEAVLLETVNKPFAVRIGDSVFWAFASFGIGLLVWFVLTLLSPLTAITLRRYHGGDLVLRNHFRGLFIPRKRCLAAPLLTLGVLVLLYFSERDNTWSSQLYLGINIIGLLIIGVFLEPVIGSKWLLMGYGVAAVAALVQGFWLHTPTVAGVATGAIIGLYGLFLSLLITRAFAVVITKSFIASVSIFLCVIILMGIAGSIDIGAHSAGFLTGFVLGFVLRVFTLRPKSKKAFEQEEGIDPTYAGYD